ncbi:MAG: hypothetical protein MJE68_06545 [Proteobacteria bacterium]|nr:hypothetical protein [Pseudomonadota bacterium]
MRLVGSPDEPVKEEEGGNGKGNVLHPEHGCGAELREGSSEQGGEGLQPQETGEIPTGGGR